VAEDREVGRRNFRRFVEANKDLREVAKSDFKSRPLDLEGCMAKDQCIIDSRLEEAESRGDRTREV
jgi:hypothetical protein